MMTRGLLAPRVLARLVVGPFTVARLGLAKLVLSPLTVAKLVLGRLVLAALVLAALVLAAVVLVVAPSAFAAPRTPYGGTVTLWSYGSQLSLEPSLGAGPAEASLTRAIYEPLYALSPEGELVPILAGGPPERGAKSVFVPLRPGVLLHDGRTLTPTQVAASLRALEGRADHLFFPLRRGPGGVPSSAAIRADEQRHGVVFDLEHEHPHYARLLASRLAGVRVPSTGGREVGTGPFQLGALAEDRVIAGVFARHRDGRPFVDSLDLRLVASRFAAGALIRRGEAALVFGAPDGRSGEERALVPWPAPVLRGAEGLGAAREVLLLAVGDRLPPELDRRTLARAIDLALHRGRLAERFLEHATPLASLAGPEVTPLAEPGPEPKLRGAVKLLVSRDDRAGHRFAERLQLDLLRAGISVTVERVPASTVEARRRDGAYELLLDALLPDAPLSSRPVDRLHGLLSLAAAHGRLRHVSAGTLPVFHAARGEAPWEVLARVDYNLRREGGLIPIALRDPAVMKQKNLEGLAVTAVGQLELAEAHFEVGPGPAVAPGVAVPRGGASAPGDGIQPAGGIPPAGEIEPGREVVPSREPAPNRELTPSRELTPNRELTPGREFTPSREVTP